MALITIRLSRQESARVARLARKRRLNRSEVIRLAIARLDENAPRGSALDDWEGVVGMVKDGPTDLSWNPRHLKGFGTR